MNKKKLELQYRKSNIKAEGSRLKRCKFCKHQTLLEIIGIGGKSLGYYSLRCAPIGLEMSRSYAIEDSYVCNAYEKGDIKGA